MARTLVRIPRFRLKLPTKQSVTFNAPSWTSSLFVHALLVAFLLWLGQREPRYGERVGVVLEVNLYQYDPGDGSDPGGAPMGSGDSDDPLEELTTAEPTYSDPLDVPIRPTAPAVRPDLPEFAATGEATAVPLPLPGGVRVGTPAQVVGGRGGRGGIGDGGGTGVGSGMGTMGTGTSFFDVEAKGAKFVYVIDSSGSMSNSNAISVAKAELMASLQNLDSKQQFQIIFYNTSLRPMLSSDGKQRLFWATDINRTLSRQFINGIQPDGGTDHLPALLEALRLEPEVIFFLTDAAEPVLNAGDLDKIRRANNGKTQINAIEFGKGPPLLDNNFLKKIAAQNRGVHRYRDITRFSRDKTL